MFTGIIEEVGEIFGIRPVTGGYKLAIDAAKVAQDAVLGASIAINGVCLTITAIDGNKLEFDAIKETVDRTNLGNLKPGDKVNLERALKLGDRLDGHFVQGHVDGKGVITGKVDSASECVFWLKPDEAILSCIIPKGSVAIDGISLTIAAASNNEFSVAIIPTTLSMTSLADRKVGDWVNIETDIVARTIVHRLQDMSRGSGLSIDTLRQNGYL